MSAPRLRAAIAVAAIVSLTACAPAGQSGPSGTAATWNDATVTNAQVDAEFKAWGDATQGSDVPGRPSIVTIDLLGPAFLDASAQIGVPVRESDALRLARDWMGYTKTSGEPSAEVVRSVQAIVALTVVASSNPDHTVLREIVDKASAEAHVNPRVGEMSADAFITSVERAIERADSGSLGPLLFIAFQDVSAFGPASSSWLVDG